MRKMIAAMKVSLDVKFQGPDDYADWVDAWSEDYDLTSTIDACVLGGKMYRGYEQYWSAMMASPTQPLPMTGTMATPGELDWARVIPSIPHYVLSKTMTQAAWSNTRILPSLEDVAAIKRQAGKNIYLMGGAQVVGECIEAGLVDEIRLILYPLLAGGPNSLFRSLGARRQAELIKAHELPEGRVRLDYCFPSAQ